MQCHYPPQIDLIDQRIALAKRHVEDARRRVERQRNLIKSGQVRSDSRARQWEGTQMEPCRWLTANINGRCRTEAVSGTEVAVQRIDGDR